MADPGRSEDDMLDDMTEVRAENNRLWMGIVRIALKADPVVTKALMRRIKSRDNRVSQLWEEIASEDSPV